MRKQDQELLDELKNVAKPNIEKSRKESMRVNIMNYSVENNQRNGMMFKRFAIALGTISVLILATFLFLAESNPNNSANEPSQPPTKQKPIKDSEDNQQPEQENQTPTKKQEWEIISRGLQVKGELVSLNGNTLTIKVLKHYPGASPIDYGETGYTKEISLLNFDEDYQAFKEKMIKGTQLIITFSDYANAASGETVRDGALPASIYLHEKGFYTNPLGESKAYLDFTLIKPAVLKQQEPKTNKIVESYNLVKTEAKLLVYNQGEQQALFIKDHGNQYFAGLYGGKDRRVQINSNVRFDWIKDAFEIYDPVTSKTTIIGFSEKNKMWINYLEISDAQLLNLDGFNDDELVKIGENVLNIYRFNSFEDCFEFTDIHQLGDFNIEKNLDGFFLKNTNASDKEQWLRYEGIDERSPIILYPDNELAQTPVLKNVWISIYRSNSLKAQPQLINAVSGENMLSYTDVLREGIKQELPKGNISDVYFYQYDFEHTGNITSKKYYLILAFENGSYYKKELADNQLQSINIEAYSTSEQKILLDSIGRQNWENFIQN